MEKNTEKQNVKRRSTFAVLFYINRTKVRRTECASYCAR